ncbi:MAG: penicillin-binding protein 2 [Candidatus Hydrogenedentota bacterium]
MSLDVDEERYDGFSGRIRFISILLAIGMLILIFRLWSLQIVRWDEFRSQSNNNRLRPQRLEAPRGMIYGRNGLQEKVILADNRAARDLMFVLADCDVEPEVVCARLESLLHIDAEELLAKIEAADKANQPHRQLLIRQDIPRGVAARIEEYGYALPGVFTVVRPVRRYVYGKTGGQIMGYLGEISQRELDRGFEGYQQGDLIGRSGVERIFQDTLHGQDGRMLVTKYATGLPQLRTDPYGKVYDDNIVDSFGHRLKLEEETEWPVPGRSKQLTLDIGLQAYCENLLKGEEGSIVVLNADTGAVLALASAPGYDPSVFVSPLAGRERTEILTSKPNRMKNRSFQEIYPPGSTFKVLLAAAALEEGVINENTTFFCGGKFRLPNVRRPWGCWKHSGHGKVSVVDALAFSCDVFFYNVGRELEIDRISEWTNKFNWGVRTGLDLPGEARGLIADREWKREYMRKKVPDDPSEWNWYPGDTINFSIGQGGCSATPLQVAVLMATMSNGGHIVTPHLDTSADVRLGDPIISAKTIDIIQRGMRKCVEKGPPAPSGTGHVAQIDGFDILGKTGSAQIVSLSVQNEYGKEEEIPKHLRDHAWFMGSVLDREPKIAVCVLFEHGHHGSSAATPLGRQVIEYFYESITPSIDVKLAQERESDEAPR